VELPEAQVEAAAEMMKREMESVATLLVPLKVETGSGETWDSAH